MRTQLRILFITLVVILSMTIFMEKCHATPRIGEDILGIQSPNWGFRDLIAYEAQNTPIGTLHNTFGSSLDDVSWLLRNLLPSHYRVHGINGPCLRNQNCGRYEITYGYTKDSFARAVRAKDRKILKYIRDTATLYRDLCGRFPGTKCLFSWILEHDLDKATWRIGADEVLKVWPDVQLVNSPDKGISVERYKGAWIERHGTSTLAGADIVSTDGEDITDVNVDKLLRDADDAKILFKWTRGYNLRQSGGAFVDPRKRTKGPSKQTQELVTHIYDDRGPAPRLNFAGCTKVIPFARPWIWKPLSEDYPNSTDPRQNLPVAITQFTRNPLELIAFNGRSAGKLGLYGTYQGDLKRHYSGYGQGSRLSGYEFEKNAKAVSGSPYTWLKSGSQCAGPLITGKRQGAFR